MALTARGKTVVGVLAVLVLLGTAALGYLLLTGQGGPLGGIVGGATRPQPCPLTGIEPEGGSPDRPALAIKIENLDVARPQAGLERADIVYEEPVEGGITRFVAIYHCRDARRVGPVRSVRVVDADILSQFGAPLFGYAGGVPPAVNRLERAGVQDLNFNDAADAYSRDPGRSAPHNLYTSTRALYRLGRDTGSPEPVFTYDPEPPGEEDSGRGRRVAVGFSPAADVAWRYRPEPGTYVRFHGAEPHTLEAGGQVAATNVVVQVVRVVPGAIIDPAGNPSPEIEVIGRGPAFVFRDGRVVEGEWVREGPEEATRFLDAEGNDIPLAPGTTWVELFPRDRYDAGGFSFR